MTMAVKVCPLTHSFIRPILPATRRISFHWLESGGRDSALGVECHRRGHADAMPKLKHQKVPQLRLMIDTTAEVVIN